MQLSSDLHQLQNLQKVEVLRQAVSQSTSRILKIPRLVHVRIDLPYVNGTTVLQWPMQRKSLLGTDAAEARPGQLVHHHVGPARSHATHLAQSCNASDKGLDRQAANTPDARYPRRPPCGSCPMGISQSHDICSRPVGHMLMEKAGMRAARPRHSRHGAKLFA